MQPIEVLKSKTDIDKGLRHWSLTYSLRPLKTTVAECMEEKMALV